jgi:hypothetical protein
MISFDVKRFLYVAGFSAALLTCGALNANAASGGSDNDNGKVTICHATGQGYVALTVGNGYKTHKGHTADINAAPGGGCHEKTATVPNGADSLGSGTRSAARGGSSASDTSGVGPASRNTIGGSSPGPNGVSRRSVTGGNSSPAGTSLDGTAPAGGIESTGAQTNGTILANGCTAAAEGIPVGAEVPIATPEPVTMLLFGAGLAGIGFVQRRRYKASTAK